jgi:signal peptidase I
MNNPSSTPVSIPPKRNKQLIILGCVIIGSIALIASLAIVLYFWLIFFTDRIRVETNSNEPTFAVGDYLLVDRSAFKLNEVKRGDFMTFFWNQNPDNEYLYRVIGLPGDSIRIQSGKVFVNEKMLIESYTTDPPNYNGSWKVSTDQFFVLGDNRNFAADSHIRGLVPYSNVIGKVLVVYWPGDHFKILK